MSQEDRANALLSHDVRELIKVSDYVADEEAEIKKLSDKFADMGYIGLLWDSKVPDKESSWYNFFSLTASNSDDVLKDIEKYQKFYKELSDAMSKISNSEKQCGSKEINPYVIIQELNVKLTAMAKTAKRGKNATASSAIYDLHKSFIQKHEMLENIIKRVECVALKEDLKKATNGWQKSINSVHDLHSILKFHEENYKQMMDKFDELMKEKKEVSDEKKAMLEMNEKLQRQMEIVLQNNADMRIQLSKIAERESRD